MNIYRIVVTTKHSGNFSPSRNEFLVWAEDIPAAIERVLPAMDRLNVTNATYGWSSPSITRVSLENDEGVVGVV